MMNFFDNPQAMRLKMLENNLLPFAQNTYHGKSLACIFLTRFCSTGCPFCYYTSKPAWRPRNIEDQFSDEGIQKFIEFSRSANLGYLLVSGGGEPLNQRKHILELIEKVQADRIVLVTSGNWAKNYSAAKRYVDDIYAAFSKREQKSTLVIRVSISEGHSIKIGLEPARNLFNIFSEQFSSRTDFKLQIKTFFNDTTLAKVLETFSGRYVKIGESEQNETDNQLLIKKIPEQYTLRFDSRLDVVVGLSKIFHSSLRPNLEQPKGLRDGIAVFEEDLKVAEDYNPTVVFNPEGEDGIDWSINYNGDICTWQNQVRDRYMNLYEDSYDEILDTTLEDPVTYAMLDKGSSYRESIVAEVNPKAVIRMKAIGLRDTSGTIIFEEEKTRLYMMIRVLSDYIDAGKISLEQMMQWDKETQAAVALSKEQLQDLFKKSLHSIISQQQEKMFNESEWVDMFDLIRLGHYDLTEDQITSGLEYFNARACVPLDDINGIQSKRSNVNRRLTERLMHIKPLKRFQSDINVAVV